ncbi:hypothetical protein PANNVG_01005 [Pantoea sp. Nvir]|uniref:SIR2 family protein n=1 Tax=Pantoea sp. Nvir TaxID=2576760 RepID=UPI0030D543AE
MDISQFFSNYKNHPILFVGAGFSMRYLEGAYSWPSLLEKINIELTGNNEIFIDLRRKHNHRDYGVDYSSVAGELEMIFEETLIKDRNGKFKDLNDEYFELAGEDYEITRFKLFISKLVNIKNTKFVNDEIALLSNASKNIASVITTNYDHFIEGTLGFRTVIGNELLLSNPYGSVYKIHGCISKPSSIIITKNDYDKFNTKNELIRAQLLSLFIHNPIIFIGYSISDSNIKNVLRTIFSYIPKETDVADEIRKNFLLIERYENINATDVITHDIDIEGIGIIKINKVITDDFSSIYRAIGELKLPVSVMDIRRVEDVFRKIKEGGDIKVKLVGDLDSLSNDELVLAVGSVKIIKYHFQTLSEMMENYFDIIDESNKELVELLDKQVISSRTHIPAYGFDKICPGMINMGKYKVNQLRNLQSAYRRLPENHKIEAYSIEDIYQNYGKSQNKINNVIFYNSYQGSIKLSSLKDYLMAYYDKKSSNYRRLLALYDLKVHN